MSRGDADSDEDSVHVSKDVPATTGVDNIAGGATDAGRGLQGDAEADEETGDGQLVQQGEELQGPFRQRPRSDLKRLPLSVEESFSSLKDELWGKIGVHKATRLHVRTSWKEKVSMHEALAKEYGPLLAPHDCHHLLCVVCSAFAAEVFICPFADGGRKTDERGSCLQFREAFDEYQHRQLRRRNLCCSAEVVNGLCVPLLCILLFLFHVFMSFVVFPKEGEHR